MAFRPSSYAPMGKVTAATVAAAVTTILVWILNQYVGVDVPTEVSGAITVLLVFLAAYLMPILPGEIEQTGARFLTREDLDAALQEIKQNQGETPKTP